MTEHQSSKSALGMLYYVMPSHAAPPSGIYVIRNTVTGDFYIGSSVNLHQRLRLHRWRLRNDRHTNPRLQAAWAKHGEPAFIFDVICLLPRDQVRPTEQRLLNRLAGLRECYNIALDASAPMMGRQHSAATRAVMLAKLKESWAHGHLTENGKARLRAARLGKPAPPIRDPAGKARRISQRLRGRKLSPAHIEKMAASKRGAKLGAYSEERRANIGRGKREANARKRQEAEQHA